MSYVLNANKMDSIFLSIISQYLKDYVNNYRKEQCSTNFLSGQGILRDLDINVDAINESISQQSAPSVRFTSVVINTLSIEAPFMSLKTKPVIVYIDRILLKLQKMLKLWSVLIH